jgi:hypothetical protein
MAIFLSLIALFFSLISIGLNLVEPPEKYDEVDERGCEFRQSQRRLARVFIRLAAFSPIAIGCCSYLFVWYLNRGVPFDETPGWLVNAVAFCVLGLVLLSVDLVWNLYRLSISLRDPRVFTFSQTFSIFTAAVKE